jgi:hypothetical protein
MSDGIRNELSDSTVDESLEAENEEQNAGSADPNLVERFRLRRDHRPEPLGILIKVVEAVQLRASNLGRNKILNHISSVLHVLAIWLYNVSGERRVCRDRLNPMVSRSHSKGAIF